MLSTWLNNSDQFQRLWANARRSTRLVDSLKCAVTFLVSRSLLFQRWYRVVTFNWCVLFLTSLHDFLIRFPNQPFGRVWWHNMQRFGQCRINNSRGLRPVRCVNFFIIICKGWILDFKYPRQTFGKGHYTFLLLYRNFIRWKQAKFFILPGNLLLRESPFHTVNYLKSFDLKLFFEYTLNWLRYLFWHICK